MLTWSLCWLKVTAGLSLWLYLPVVFCLTWTDPSRPFVRFHPAAPCFICPVCVVGLGSPLPSPNISGLQLVCFAGLSEFRLQSPSRTPALVFPGEGEELMLPGCCHIKKDGPPPGSVGLQIEYLLVFAAAPLPSPPCTHIDTTCGHIYPWRWLPSFVNLFVCHLLSSPLSTLL